MSDETQAKIYCVSIFISGLAIGISLTTLLFRVFFG